MVIGGKIKQVCVRISGLSNNKKGTFATFILTHYPPAKGTPGGGPQGTFVYELG